MIVTLATLTMAGCGSSQSSEPSKLVAVADPICRSIAERRAETNAAVNAASSRAKALQVLARLAPGVAAYERQETNRLASLRGSGSQAHGWQTMLAGMRQLDEDTTRIGIEAEANNFQAVRATDASGARLRKQLTAIAQREGFVYCGRTT